jgi:hypothetical protein
MLKKTVVIGAAIVVFACAVIINLAILDLLSIDEVRESLGKILSVIGVSTVAIVLVLVLARAITRTSGESDS